MSATPKALRATADLIEHRDSLKRIMGAKYSGDVREARAILTGYAKENRIDIAEAALAIAKDLDAKHIDPSIIFAAFVEEFEAASLTRHIALTPELIQRRDDLKARLGLQYGRQVAVARRLLLHRADRGSLSLEDAALNIAQQIDDMAADPGIIWAAFVEECEAGR